MIDVVNCDQGIQPLGFLVCAAGGKDPRVNPKSLLAAASRSHYSPVEIDALDFEGPQPNASTLGLRWHEILSVARGILERLPSKDAGKCVVNRERPLFTGCLDELESALKDKTIGFHDGQIGGSWPTIKSSVCP